MVRKQDSLVLSTQEDVVTARQMTRILAIQAGLNLVDQTRIVTAASELARNTVIYGGGGTVEIEVLEDTGRTGLRLRFEDQGPGIPDIEKALTNGFTTGTGLGLGLGGAKRLSSEFHIWSEAGKGTRVEITRWKG